MSIPCLPPVEWNNTRRALPANLCLHELIEAQVGRTPDATALIFDDESLTYSEPNRRANRLAHRLLELGVGAEVIVGIFAECSVETVIGLVATLKAGGAYLPLDPDYLVERVAFMLGQAKPQHLRGELGDKLLRVNESFHKLTLGWAAPGGRRNPATAAAEFQDLHVQMVHERAFLAHRPLPYGGKVTLLRTLDQDSAYEVDRDLGWGAVAQGGVEVQGVPGTHLTMFSDDNVQELAGKVAQCIQAATSKQPHDQRERSARTSSVPRNGQRAANARL
jgi:hypothetical protein